MQIAIVISNIKLFSLEWAETHNQHQIIVNNSLDKYYKEQCGVLNKNCPHRMIYLNA